MRKSIVVTALLVGAGCLPVLAAGDVPPALAARLAVLVPGAEPDHVVETRMAGMYEVRFGSIIVYLSGDGRYMLRGDLVDLESGRNVTEEARRTVRAEVVGALGEANMIVFAAGCGEAHRHRLHRRRLRVLRAASPADGRLQPSRHQEFATPRSRGPESAPTPWDKMVSVWCAADQHTAMTDAKARRRVEPARCANPVAEQYEAGKAIGVRGTPAIVLESGEIIPGYVPPEELASRLDERTSG